MHEAVQALCFLAGANSIFYGEKLLTTGNPDVGRDDALFAALGLVGRLSAVAQAGLAAIGRGLEELERDGLLRARRVLDSPQGPVDRRGRAGARQLRLQRLPRPREPPAHPRRGARARSTPGASAPAPLPSSSGTRGRTRRPRRAFARFTGLPRALLFPSGYAANLGILTALADRSAEIFADRLNHACLNDGAVLSRAAFRRYPHGDLERLEATARRLEGRHPRHRDRHGVQHGRRHRAAAGLLALAERHDAWLVLDDAHGIGVLGRGRGRARPFRPALAAHRLHGHARQGAGRLRRLRRRRAGARRMADAAGADLRVLDRPAARGGRRRRPPPCA